MIILSLVGGLLGAALATTPDLPARCEDHLRLDADLARRFRLRGEAMAAAAPADARLLRALQRVRDMSDDAVSRLIFNLLKSGEPADAAAELNPFLREHPELLTPSAREALPLVRDALAGDFDEYEIGLIAALAPESPKIKPEDPDAPLKTSGVIKAGKLRFDRAMERPTLKLALIELLDRLAAQDEFLLLLNFRLPPMHAHCMDAFVDRALVSGLVRRLRSGRLNDRDFVRLVILLGSMYDGSGSDEDRRHSPHRRTMMHEGVSVTFWDRDWVVANAERFMTERLHVDSGLLDTVMVYRSLAHGDPLPLDARVLREQVLTNARGLVDEVRRRMTATEPKAPAAPAQPRTIEPMQLRLTDQFEPPATSTRKRSAPKVSGGSDEPPRIDVTPTPIDEAANLLRFTSFVPNARPLEELTPERTYALRFIRDASARTQYVRFSADVLRWIVDNPDYGRPVLNAINLGWASGRLSGLKFMRSTAPRRHEGSVYEVKIFGKYRPLVIRLGQVWQVIKVVDKDEIDQALTKLKPLAEPGQP